MNCGFSVRCNEPSAAHEAVCHVVSVGIACLEKRRLRVLNFLLKLVHFRQSNRHRLDCLFTGVEPSPCLQFLLEARPKAEPLFTISIQAFALQLRNSSKQVAHDAAFQNTHDSRQDDSASVEKGPWYWPRIRHTPLSCPLSSSPWSGTVYTAWVDS